MWDAATHDSDDETGGGGAFLSVSHNKMSPRFLLVLCV